MLVASTKPSSSGWSCTTWSKDITTAEFNKSKYSYEIRLYYDYNN